MEDIITGKIFNKDKYDSEITSTLKAYTLNELTEQQVVDYLKKFKSDDIIRYKEGMKKLEESYQEDYKEYISETELKKKEKEKILEYNRQFINDFKNNNIK